MSEVAKNLNNIRSLRVFARENSLEVLEAVAEKLAIVIEEKREAVKAQALKDAKRREDLSKYKELMEKDGVSIEELAALFSGETPVRKQRVQRPAKYKFIDAEGNEKTWTGQGRTPKPIQDAINAGKSLADFEI